MYGSRNDRELWYRTVMLQRGMPFQVTPFPATYNKVDLEWNDALYGISSNIECIPHLAQWGMDQVKHKKPMLNWIVRKALVPYLANMNDDELAMVEPLLRYIEAFGKVMRVQGYADSVELCVEINGVQRTLLLTVMNMMEYQDGYDHYIRRNTIN